MAAFRYFRHRLRTILLIFLSINLILTIVRQVFDFMGYVWSPIAANFLNIIFTIFAIFAMAQLRFTFFVVYVCWSPFWLAWNSFLICYYLNVGALNRDDARALSWGTGGRSWWSGHTPGCQRVYNATSATVEIGECKFLQPFYVEIIQSAVHLILTVCILIQILAFIFIFPRKVIGEPYNSLPRRRSATTRPHVTVEIGPTPPSTSVPDLDNNAQTVPANAVDTSFARSSDLSSGYLNVSYDTSPAGRKHTDESAVANGGGSNRPPPPQPLQNYRRNSQKRRSSSGSVQRRTREKSRERVHANHDLPISDHQSSNSPATLDDHPPSLPRSRSNSTNRQDAMTSQMQQLSQAVRTSPPRQSQRLARPVQDLGDLLSGELISNAVAAPEFVESKSSFQKQEEPRRQPIVRTYHRRDPEVEDSAPVVDYSMEPRRIGAAKGQQASAEPFRPLNPIRRSVISFDPKSDGDTLLRFHDHLARSQETILSRASTSMQQQPQFGGTDVVSFDSGFPPSRGGGSDDDPRLSQESQTLSAPGFARQQHHHRQPIGYEPAFMMSYEPANSQDEPIYRPSFLRPAGSSQSPVKFRYHDNNGKALGNLPPHELKLNGADYLKPNSLLRVGDYSEVPNGKGRHRVLNGHADTASNGSSGSETSSLAGLAVPRISNSSLLV